MLGTIRHGFTRRVLVVPLFAVAFNAGCTTDVSPPPVQQPAETMPESIGVATMDADGTIVLMLRATTPGGGLAEAQVRYPKGHEQYDAVLKHLGGLRPGESKPVPPWPDPPDRLPTA